METKDGTPAVQRDDLGRARILSSRSSLEIRQAGRIPQNRVVNTFEVMTTFDSSYAGHPAAQYELWVTDQIPFINAGAPT